MTQRRRGLGRGLGALIPTARPEEESVPGSLRAQHANGWTEPDEPAPSEAERGSALLSAPRHDDASEGPEWSPNGTGQTAAGQTAAGRTAAELPASEQSAPIRAGLARFAEVDVHRVRRNPRQPRDVFDEDAHAELVQSIRQVGVLQPVVVRELTGDGGADEADFELVMGERRWRAARDAGLATVPAIIRDTPDTALLRDALLENLHRAQLNPLEEAAAYDQLLQDFSCTQDELAERIGRSRPQISNTLRLLRLPPSVQRRLAAGVLSAGHARALLGLSDAVGQERLAQRVVAEGLSVRSVEEIVALGDAGADARTTASRGRRPVAPALADLASRLSDRFETRVRVDLGRRKGRIVVEFATIADLERIVAAMDPTAVAAVPTQSPPPSPA